MTTRNRQLGATLNELLLALAVGAVLVGLAVPAFTTLTKNNRLITETNTLVGHINLARSEAIKRNLPVALCRSADPEAANPVCGGTANTWSTGWIVFVDDDLDADNTDGDDNGTFDAGELLLRRWIPSGGVQIKTDADADSSLSIAKDGSNNAGSTAEFALCDDRGTASGRQINVGPVGRPAIQRPPDDCASP